VLATPELANGPVLEVRPVGPWFAQWGRGTAAQHPHRLTDSEDVERILSKQRARAEAGDYPILFARKFDSSSSGAALAAIDELRSADRTEDLSIDDGMPS
jgi:hypothetical protein